MPKNDKKKEITNTEQFAMLEKIKTEVRRSQQRWNLISSYVKKFKPKNSKPANMISINGYMMNQLSEEIVEEIRGIVNKYAEQIDTEKRETEDKIKRIEKELNNKK